MGIHGLTTYLREHKPVLSRTLNLVQLNRVCEARPPTPIVIDGWSFIYELMRCSGLPWVYGGEYDAYARLVERVVHAWLDVGLQPHFVFDGPYPGIKFPTLISRTTRTRIQGGLLFFRTSAVARAAPRFLHETAMLPPLVYSVCVQTLLRLASAVSPRSHRQIHVHFADQEGDPYAVALAGRLGAYVAGRDSDFVVLNTEGYKGYVPLDEMVWSAAVSSAAASETGSVYSSVTEDVDSEVDEGGFKTVRKIKTRKRAAANQRAGQGLIPPDDSPASNSELTLTLVVYTPEALATHLQIPASVLPLLGALVGNDFTGAADDTLPASSSQHAAPKRGNLQYLFFERQLTLVQRIVRVANTLRSLLPATAPPGSSAVKRKQKRQVGSVMELIDAAVSALLIRSPESLAAGEREAIVDRIVEATLQYAISRPAEPEREDGDDEREYRLPWMSDTCILHDRRTCPLYAALSRSSARQASTSDSDTMLVEPNGGGDDFAASICALYIDAYRRGSLGPRVLDPFVTGTSWPWIFLEHPDKESVVQSIGRPIREWTYAVLEAGLGLIQRADPDTEDGDDDEDGHDSEDELIDVVEEDDDAEDELIDVVEGDEDLLAPLRGALAQLGNGQAGQQGDGGVAEQSMSAAVARAPPSVVTEYVRRGTRLAAEDVAVPALPEVLRALAVTVPRDRLSVPAQLWPEDLRRTFLLRALGSDVPRVRALRGAELAAVLAVRWVVRRMHARALDSAGSRAREEEMWSRDEARAFLAAFAWGPDPGAAGGGEQAEETVAVPIVERNVQLVAQLHSALESIEQFGQALLLSEDVASPALHFSGRRFHAALTKGGQDAAVELDEQLWQACVEGLEGAFATPMPKKAKKDKKRGAVGGALPTPGQPLKGRNSSAKKPGSGMYDLLAQLEA